MTTDEGASNNGENPATTVVEQGEDITTKKDRGVLKIVKRVGTTDESPMIGDKVFVHYKGKLSNGKKFESSHDRNEPFVFSLGKGKRAMFSAFVSVCFCFYIPQEEWSLSLANVVHGSVRISVVLLGP